ncbi:MAG TPA: TonB-dependent receptor plug domain-containing protein [Flavitalea sp.]|nr:TonB-dependent receptor plug domain-containing protein [Flavitalea sp.]
MQKLIAIVLILLPSLIVAQSDSALHYDDSLRRSALFLEPVEVRAIRASENSPFAKSTITAAEIKKTNLAQDLPFLLNQTPSVVINSDAGNGVGYTGIRIRGSDATRINMTINGIPYNDAESQGLFFVNLPDLASSVSDVQIQRGIGTSSNGAGAFGATMNFSTNEVNLDPYAEINNSTGSFNTWKHTVKTGTGLLNNHFTFDARLSKISSDGYIDRAKTNLHSFYVSSAYLTANTSIRLNVLSGREKTYQAWNGITGDDLKNNRTINYSGTEKPGEPYDNETDNYQQDHYQLFINHRLNDKIEFNTALFLTQGKGFYENYKAGQSFKQYGLNNLIAGNDTINETDLVRQLWLDNNFFGQILSMQYKQAKGILTAGGGWNRYEGKHFGVVPWAQYGFPVNYRFYDLGANKTDVNVYTKYQYRVARRTELFGDVQYRNINYDLGGFRDNPTLSINNKYNFVNPKAGITYTLQNVRLYASYSYAAKEPNRDDFEAGLNQQPRPEKMHDVEAGIEKKLHRWTWAANIYYMKYRDQLVPTGKINDVGAYTRINIPDSYRAGIELQTSAAINNWLHIAGNVALSCNKVKNFTAYFDDYDNGGQKTINYYSAKIAFSPAVVGGASFDFKPFKNAELNFISKYVARQYLDNTSSKERSLDPFFVQDARFAYTLSNKYFKSASIIFQVNNLFDTRYEANGYTYSYQNNGRLVSDNYYFPMAGINVMIGVNMAL